MAAFPSFSFSYTKPFHFLIFTFLTITLTSKSASSISFLSHNRNPNFETEITLFGDAHFTDGGSSVQLNRPMRSSSGLLIRNKPFKFIDSKRRHMASFSTEVTFSISPDSGDGYALVIVPTVFPSKFPGKSSFGLSPKNRFFAVEFDTSMEENWGDISANHVGIDVCGLVSARVSDVSKINLVLNSGVKLFSWIDYHASLKKLDVRLSKLGDRRPDEPLLTYTIDLGEMWKEEEVVLGLISSSGKSLQTTSVYSWRSKVENVPKWLHSQPVNPQDYINDHGERKSATKRNVCLLYGFMFAIGFGVLAALALLVLGVGFQEKEPMIRRESAVCPVDFRYEKINVVVDDSSKVVKK